MFHPDETSPALLPSPRKKNETALGGLRFLCRSRMWRGGGAPRAPSRARAPSPALAHRSRARPRSSPADFFCLFISFTSPSFLLQPPIAPGAPRCRAERRKEVRPRGRLLLFRQGRCLVLRRRIRRWINTRRRPIQHQVLECHCSHHYIPGMSLFFDFRSRQYVMNR